MTHREYQLPYYIISGFVIVAFLGTVIPIMWNLQGYIKIIRLDFPLTLTTYSQLLSAFGSIVLTFSLVLLYGEQTDIQNRQEQWMEAEHVPDIFVDTWELNKAEFEFNLTNLGTGIAKNVEVHFQLKPVGSDTNIQAITGVAPLEQDEILTRVLPLASDTDQKSVQMSGEHDLRIQYRGIEGDVLCNTRSEDAYLVLRRILGDLSSSDGKLEYKISICYDYIRREDDTKSVYAGQSSLETDIDFEGLLLATGRVLDSDLNVEPENLKES